MDDLTRWAGDTIAEGSKSFALASRLFDVPTRRRAWLLYAWCRHCDDVIDGQHGGQGRVADSVGVEARLLALVAATEAAMTGPSGRIDAFSALFEVVRETSMPPQYPIEHLAGFAMDAQDRVYRGIDDTLDYCYHVAGVVGVMMAIAMGIAPGDEAVLVRAADLGIAFQLTNISRDVLDDAAIGRCYLPADWLADAGIPPGEHARPEHRGALAVIVSRLLDLADAYYASARAGAARLPRRSAWAVLSAAAIYRAIGAKVRTAGIHAWDTRQHTSRLEKLGIVWHAFGEARAKDSAQPLSPRPALWRKV